MRGYALLLLFTLLLSIVPTSPPEENRPNDPPVIPGLQVPAGFEVTEYAGSDLANDIYTMTVDPKGRIVVAGRGYIRILVDDNNDGKADRAIPFADTPRDGAMGMLWEGDSLYVTGDGGLRVFRDANEDDQADGPSRLIRKMKTGGEHAAHAVRRGPDGWLYVLCGNNTGIDKSYAQLPTSPIQKPVAGCVLRFSPDLKKSEIVAHGFRNAYGMDFNPDGELFTYDSDNERCVSLPWYEHTRLYHVIPGGFHGWLSPQRAQFWRFPPYYADVVAPVTTLDRGSPTGVACYRHVQFPAKYQGGLFALDWTFGRVYFVQLTRKGSTYSCQKEIFLQSVGENGFAPTGVVVHPQTGDLFLSIGGRGTRGAVYRVRYKAAPEKIDRARVKNLQPVPRSLSLSREEVKNLPKQLASHQESENLLRTLHLIRRYRSQIKDEELVPVLPLPHKDRYIQQATAELISTLDKKFQNKIFQDIQADPQEFEKDPTAALTLAQGLFETQPKKCLQLARRVLQVKAPAPAQLRAVRIIQMALGDLVSPKSKGTVFEGYTFRHSLKDLAKNFGAEIIQGTRVDVFDAFPMKQSDLDWELSRTLAALEDADPRTIRNVRTDMQAAKDPVESLHYLIVLACLEGPRDERLRGALADQLLNLESRMEQLGLKRDRHWPSRIRELYRELARKDPQLHKALLNHKDFGQPYHALFALSPGFDRAKAARLFLKKSKAEPDYLWNDQSLKVLGSLPIEERFPVFRSLWNQAGVDDTLLTLLAKHPQKEDREKFVSGLKSPQLAIVQTSLQALQKLNHKAGESELLVLVKVLDRIPAKQAKTLHKNLVQYLEEQTGQKWEDDTKAWRTWFAKTYPSLADKLNNSDGVDRKAWDRRLEQIDWSRGLAKKGQRVFVKANCASCHSGGQALGPDLHGITKRFSRQDILTAILQPNRDVSPRYQTTLIETKNGQVYQGLVIYQAVDGTILQTDATTTIRIPGDQIVQQQPVTTSLMPPGLLDRLSDEEIADLFIYLKSL